MDNIRHTVHRGRERLKHVKEKFSISQGSSLANSVVDSRKGSTVPKDRRATSPVHLRLPTDPQSVEQSSASVSTAGPSKGSQREASVGRSQVDEEISGESIVRGGSDGE
jgi:hypothetical protein